MTGPCRCSHSETAHDHYRPGSSCALCGCPRYRPNPLGTVTEPIRRHLVPTTVRRWMRRLHTLARLLDHLENYMSTPTPDRDLITTILAGLAPIADAIRAKDEAIRAKDATIAEQAGKLEEAGIAAAADAQTDALALAPVADLVDTIKAALEGSTTTPAEPPAPIPVEELPAAVEEAVQAETTDPGPVPDASTEA